LHASWTEVPEAAVAVRLVGATSAAHATAGRRHATAANASPRAALTPASPWYFQRAAWVSKAPPGHRTDHHHPPRAVRDSAARDERLDARSVWRRPPSLVR